MRTLSSEEHREARDLIFQTNKNGKVSMVVFPEKTSVQIHHAKQIAEIMFLDRVTEGIDSASFLVFDLSQEELDFGKENLKKLGCVIVL